jgi:glucosamine--fructose-6-phosphate aminotransferase (isomerizing)
MREPSTFSPLLAADSLLSARQRQLVRQLHDVEQAKISSAPSIAPLDPQRRIRVERTQGELRGAPDAISRTLSTERDEIETTARQLARNPIRRVILVGCGDSLAALACSRWFMETTIGVPCHLEQSLDYAYYGSTGVTNDTLVVALSAGGRSTRTLEALMAGRQQGALTLGVSCDRNSYVLQEAHLGLVLHASRAGWPTQASLTAVVVLMHLAVRWAKATRNHSHNLEASYRAISAIPELLDQTIREQEEPVAEIARLEAAGDYYLFSGGGPAYGCALLGASRLRECSPSRALAVPLEELHHYNYQRQNDPLWLIAPTGRTLGRALDSVRRSRRAGGRLYLVRSQDDHALTGVADVSLDLPPMSELIAPVVYAVPAQWFAYYVAMIKFRLAEAAAQRHRRPSA